MVSYALKN